MAVVKRRKADGGYYVQGTLPHSRSVCTWQVTGAGVEWLYARGLAGGGHIDRDALNEMHRRGFLYTGGTGITIVPAAGHATVAKSGTSGCCAGSALVIIGAAVTVLVCFSIAFATAVRRGPADSEGHDR